jgi:hypothetical protein
MDPREVRREYPARAGAVPSETGTGPKVHREEAPVIVEGKVRLTNLDKIFFPQDGSTKGNVILHYRAVPRMSFHMSKDTLRSSTATPTASRARTSSRTRCSRHPSGSTP